MERGKLRRIRLERAPPRGNPQHRPSRPVAGVPTRPNPFFRVGPAETQCFAVRRGEVSERAEAIFHRPWIRHRLSLSHNSKFAATNLGNICLDIRYGSGSPPPYLDADNDTVPFVRATDIKEGEINLDTLLHVAAEQPSNMHKSRLTGGEVIIVRSGANTGDCAFVPRFLTGSFAAYDLILTFQSEVVAKFVANFLDTKVGRLQLDLVKGRSAQPHINAREVAAVQVPWPSMSVQENMVAAMDAARTERKAKLTEADALLTGADNYIMDALGIRPPIADRRRVFAVRGQAVPRRFDPHFHSPTYIRIHETLSQIRCESLGNIVDFSKETVKPQGHDQPTFRYIEINSVNPRTGEARWNDVQAGEAPSRARMVIRADDIVVSLTRPHHGSIAHLGSEFDGCIASTGFAVIREIAAHIRRDYLWCILRSQLCLQQMLQRASGGNYPAITEQELMNIVVPVPDIDTQKTISAEIDRRRQETHRLGAEADAGWQAARWRFEGELLGLQ